MTKSKVKIYQKTSSDAMTQFLFSSTASIIDMDGFVKYTDQQIAGTIPDLSDATNVSDAIKYLDGNTRKALNLKLSASSIATGATNGTIAVNGTDVAVHGLASGAYAAAYVHPATSGNKHIPSGGSSGEILRWSADGTAVWGADSTYSDFLPSGSTAAHGLVPKPPTTEGDTKYLREDGTWSVPPDTKYTHPTTSGNKHIPSGGSSGQVLKYSADGTATWATLSASDVGAAPSDINTGVMSVTASSTNGKVSVDGADVTVYTHPSTAGNKHIPAGGSSGQILKYSAAGTAAWADEYSYTHPTTSGNKHIPSGGSSGQVLKYSADGTATWATLSASDVGAAPSDINTGVMSVTTGTDNGTISVDGTDVAVKGLGTGAYAAAYTHPTSAGNKHIPSGGSAGKVLLYGGSSGTASWGNLTASDVGAAPSDIDTGVMSVTASSTNGKVSVDGTDVAVYTHPTTAGNKHIPSGGSSGQVLKYSSSGTATWATLSASDVGALASDGTAAKATADASGNVITTTYATKSEVSAIPKFAIEVVETLPTTNISPTTVYLVATGSESQNLYTEYIYVNSAWEKLGTQTIDLSGYAKKSDIATGSANGTISVDGADVAVKGLDTGAYAAAYVHPTTAGNKHIPAGGSSGQILKYSAAGTAAWANEYSYTHPTTAGNKHIPTGGSTGQVLKYGGSSGTASWATLSASDVGAAPSDIDTGVMSVATGSTNGTISVDGTDVAVKGLGTGAYAAAYTHPTTSGNKHIPSGGSSGQILKYSADGTATWANEYSYTHPTTAGNKHIPSGGASGNILVYSADGTAAWGTNAPTATSAGKLTSAVNVDGVSFDGSVGITHYGTCGTAAGTAAKTVDCTGFVLETGARIIVKFTVTNTATNPTLSVNSTTAAAIYYRGAAIAKGELAANRLYEFVYDGTHYELIGSVDTVYTHPTSAGNKHIPSGGSSGQVLKYSSSGTATWATLSASDVGAAPSDINTGVMSVAEGATNGTISVDGTDVAVHGLASGAYAAAYTHPTTSGNKHIPSGGSSGQILKYSADGTATWAAEYSYTHPTTAGNLHIPSGGSSNQVLVYGGSSGTASWGAVPTHTHSEYLTAHQTIKQDAITGATGNRYGACGTAAGTAAKTVSITAGTPTLEAGLRVTIKFTNANTAGTPTLNVNSLGAKNIFHKGAQITTGDNKALLAGICDFVYDGTQFHLVGNYIDTNTVYTHPTTSGNKHIPSGGASGNILKWSADGTATWAAEYSYTHPTTAGNLHIPSGGSSNQVLVYGGSSGTASWGAVPTHTHSEYLTSHQTIKQNAITGATANAFGACSTAAATAAKTVSVTAGTPTLETGLRVTVKFTNGNTAAGATLNVNSTGAKAIYYRGATLPANMLCAGVVADLVYDGTYFQLIGNWDSWVTDET